jgi:hypothetical protein
MPDPGALLEKASATRHRRDLNLVYWSFHAYAADPAVGWTGKVDVMRSPTWEPFAEALSARAAGIAAKLMPMLPSADMRGSPGHAPGSS